MFIKLSSLENSTAVSGRSERIEGGLLRLAGPQYRLCDAPVGWDVIWSDSVCGPFWTVHVSMSHGDSSFSSYVNFLHRSKMLLDVQLARLVS